MVQALEEILAKSSRIVFFGGAGVSTESGIPDFRSVDGLYHQKYDYPPETILSHTFWEQNPEEFYRFYRDKLIVKGAKPNAAHLRLAKLEKQGKLKAVAIAAVFALTRLRSDPAGKQAQTILTLLLSSSDAVEPAADDSYTASEPGLVQVDDGGFAAFYQAQFGDCMTQQCLEKLLANRLPTRIASLSGQPAGLTLQKRSGADHCYDFSADLQAADGTTTASVTGTITMVKEDGAWKASDLTLNLK